MITSKQVSKLIGMFYNGDCGRATLGGYQFHWKGGLLLDAKNGDEPITYLVTRIDCAKPRVKVYGIKNNGVPYDPRNEVLLITFVPCC